MTLDRRLVVDALPSYEIGEEIGRGGWGVVLAAHHRELGRSVAIKQLPRAFAADPTVRLRFKEEARLIASLDHPHIVPVYDFVEREGLCLIVMELMPNGTLWDKFVDTGLPVDQACGQMLAASAALQAAHGRGILHRDVKPENFLFTANGVIKLGDFGIAKLLDDTIAGHTLSGQIIGTPAYMSPEQAAGEPIGAYTDVYSCAVMLYELLTGELPFVETDEPLVQLMKRLTQPPNPIEVARPDIPRAIGQTVMQGLARNPAERFPTAQEWGESLARAATVAFGPGWLLRSGVEVLGAPGLVAVTSTPVTGAGEGLPIAKRTIRPNTMHVRLGDALDSDGVTASPPLPAPGPGLTPPPIAAPPAAPGQPIVAGGYPSTPPPLTPAAPPTPPPFTPDVPPTPPPLVGAPAPAPVSVPPPAPEAQPIIPGPPPTLDPHAPTVGPAHPTPVGSPGPATPPPAVPYGGAQPTGGQVPPPGWPAQPGHPGQPAGPPPAKQKGKGALVAVIVILLVVVLAGAGGAYAVIRSRSTTATTNANANGNGNEAASNNPVIADIQPGAAANTFAVTWKDAGGASEPHRLYAFGDHFENVTAATSSPTTATMPAPGGACFVLVRGTADDRSQIKCVNGGDESLVKMDQLKS